MTGHAVPSPDEDAERRLETLYRAQLSSLIGYFRRNRASPADAEEMAQESFLRMAGAPGEVARPAAYLRRIGVHLIAERATAPVHRHEVEAPIALDDAISEADELARLEARDSLRRIEAALYRLKPKTREIFLAHRLDGMTYTEIAERTGLSVKGVEKQMSKAIAHVSRALGDSR